MTDTDSVDLRPLPPDRYREFARLGEGSMGLVYLALDTELNRRIAFKMIRPLEEEGAEPLEATPSPEDESFPEMKARFLQEAWVTGGLEHPGIVPVYELGETTGGIPYYTMRVVRGEKTLADAIEQAQGLDGRLALLEPFLRICDTVRYAHARGVIHRDLKPANIALGDYGETVVLDWGLAKLKDRPDLARSVWQKRIEELRDETDLETLASAIGTPGYMSPEAALVEIDKVDARSDVYSVGAILYRILTGKLPYEFQSYPELVQKLKGEVPRDPSEVDAAVPAGLSRICLKALSAEREQRYADADEVAAAIRAWQRESALEREVAALLREAESALETAPNLQGEALLRQVDRVTAVCARIFELRPGDARAEALQLKGHQLRERAIVERERGARKRLLKRVAVIGLATATAATVIVALLLDAKRREAEEARTREAQARTRAEQERVRAEDLAGFMLFDLRDGLRPIGRLDLLAKVALKSKEYYDSLPSEGVTDEQLRQRSTALSNLGDVLCDQGNLDAALHCYLEARQLAETYAARDSSAPLRQRLQCTSLNRVATTLHDQGHLAEALKSHEEQLAIARSLSSRHPGDAGLIHEVFVALSGKGRVLQGSGEGRKARECYEEALGLARALVARDPSNRLWTAQLEGTYSNVAVLQQITGDAAAAQRSLEEGLLLAERLVRQDPKDVNRQTSLAIALGNLSRVLDARGEIASALQHLRRAVQILGRLAESDPTNATRQHDLCNHLAQIGDLHQAKGEWNPAEEAYREALGLRKRLCSLDPANRAWRLGLCKDICRVGDCREAAGDANGAAEHYREALLMSRRSAEEHPQDPLWLRIGAMAGNNLGGVLVAIGDVDGALACQRDVVDSARRLAELAPSPDSHRMVAVCLEQLGVMLQKRGDQNGAIRAQLEAVAIGRELMRNDPTNLRLRRGLAVHLFNVAEMYRRGGELTEAAKCCRESVEISLFLLGTRPSHPVFLNDLVVFLRNLSRIGEARGEFGAAARYVREVRDRLREGPAASPQLKEKFRELEDLHTKLLLLAGELTPASATDHVWLAGACYKHRDYLRGAKHWTAALEDETVRCDLAKYTLYNAACCGALASATSEGEEARGWRAQAIKWLREDLGMRRKAVEEAGGDGAERLRAHLEDARMKDPDFASLRGTPEFEALFEEKGGAR